MDNLYIITAVKLLIVRRYEYYYSILDIYITADISISINILDTQQLRSLRRGTPS